MRALVQRVTKANVTVNGKVQNAIGRGLLVFLGVEPDQVLHQEILVVLYLLHFAPCHLR